MLTLAQKVNAVITTVVAVDGELSDGSDLTLTPDTEKLH